MSYSSRMKKLIATGAAVVGVALVGTLGAVSCDADSASHGSTSKVVSPAPVRTQSMKDKITEWYSDVSTDYLGLMDDLADAESSANTYDVSGVNAACLSGLTHVHNLQVKPSLPGNDALWNQTLDHMDTAFQACTAGDYTTSTEYLLKASSDLVSLNAAVEKYI